LGVACSGLSSGVTHIGCAAARYEKTLLDGEAKYLKQRRRERHQVSWEAARARKKPKLPAPTMISAAIEAGPMQPSPAAMMRPSSWWREFRQQASSLSTSVRQLFWDWVSPRWQMEEDCTTKTNHERFHTASGKCLGFFWPFVTPVCSRASASRCGRRLVQQGCRGAHLARMTAARRGARISKWSKVRQHRAAHCRAHSSSLNGVLSFTIRVLTWGYRQALRIGGSLSSPARWQRNRDICRRASCMNVLSPSATQAVSNLLLSSSRLCFWQRSLHAGLFAAMITIGQQFLPAWAALAGAYVAVKSVASRSGRAHSASCRCATASVVAVAAGACLGLGGAVGSCLGVLLLPHRWLW